jgi:hypothetical protein
MEHLMDTHLNQPREEWTPWEQDERIQWLIATGQAPSINEEAPGWYSEASSSLQIAA